eukprot:3941720-Rhodomonas_salina.2
MSATINAHRFSDYFGGAAMPCEYWQAVWYYAYLDSFARTDMREYHLEDALEATGHRIAEGSEYAVGGSGQVPYAPTRMLYNVRY